MKILILINSSWNVVNFRTNLIKELVHDGHEVIAMAPKDDYSHLLKEIGCEFVNISFKSRSTNPLIELKLFFKIFFKIKNIKPDILLTFTIKPNIYGSIAANLLGIKTINNIAGLGITASNFFFRNFSMYLYKFALARTDLCFFQNESDKSFFLDNKIIKYDKSDLIPGSGVDLEKFSIKDSTYSHNVNKKFTFLLSSRLLWSKGIKEYVEAAKLIQKKFDNTDFWLVGFSGVDNNDAIDIKIIQDWHDKNIIQFKGSTDDIKSILSLVDCYVLPTFYPEGTPKSLLEAAAMQLPIITTNTPGCRNVVIDGVTGFLCEPKNHIDLYKKMELILNSSKNELDLMGSSARELMKEKYDDKIVSKRYLKAINTLYLKEKKDL